METNETPLKIVPLKGSIEMTTGSILKMIYPNMTSGQRLLIRVWLALERLQNFSLWKR